MGRLSPNGFDLALDFLDLEFKLIESDLIDQVQLFDSWLAGEDTTHLGDFAERSSDIRTHGVEVRVGCIY